MGVAVCCRVLQCLILRFRVLQCVAVCCGVLQYVIIMCYRALQCVAVCCSVLQCVSVCCSALSCIAVHCIVLQCVSVCHRVSQTITTNDDLCQIPGLLSSAENVLLGCQSWDVSNSSFTPRSLHSIQVCGSVLQYIAVCCSALQSVAECCWVTGWQRLIGSPKLQIIFHKRATKYRSLLRKMTYKDKGSYESWPPCISHAKYPT